MNQMSDRPREAEETRKAVGEHTLKLEKQRHASITGISDVCSFHENEILLRLNDSELVLTGKKLHVAKLSLENGEVLVDGYIDGAIYQPVRRMQAKKRLWARRET